MGLVDMKALKGFGTGTGAQPPRLLVEMPVSRGAQGVQPGGLGRWLPLFWQVPASGRCH